MPGASGHTIIPGHALKPGYTDDWRRRHCTGKELDGNGIFGNKKIGKIQTYLADPINFYHMKISLWAFLDVIASLDWDYESELV